MGGWWGGVVEGLWGGCDGVGFWRVHGVGRCVVVWVVVGWVVGGFMGVWMGCGMGDWRVHGVGAYTHPSMNSYNVKTFHFMNTLLLYMYSPSHEQL